MSMTDEEVERLRDAAHELANAVVNVRDTANGASVVMDLANSFLDRFPDHKHQWFWVEGKSGEVVDSWTMAAPPQDIWLKCRTCGRQELYTLSIPF